MTPIDVVIDYHERSKHRPHLLAPAPDTVDEVTRPDTFRRYEGAELLELDLFSEDEGVAYDNLFLRDGTPIAPLNRRSVSQLLFDSLSISACKLRDGALWPVRVNPSSGNLHPTEVYLVCGPIPELEGEGAVYHYAPHEHALEVRCRLPADAWQSLVDELPDSAFLVGMTLVYSREWWKYGERSFRYCHHDLGHAIGAIAMAAAALGWEARLIDEVTDAELASLVGISDQTKMGRESPGCLLAIAPRGESQSGRQQHPFQLPILLRTALASVRWAGRPNEARDVSKRWPRVDAVTKATTRRAPSLADHWSSTSAPRASTAPHRQAHARQIFRGRRSAVAMDSRTSIGREAFFDMLRRLDSAHGAPPFATLLGRPSIHLSLFIHRVIGLPQGLYLLVREASQRAALREALGRDLRWERTDDVPPELDLWLLLEGDFRATAHRVCCYQRVASDGIAAVAMIAPFEQELREHGPAYYRRIHWEAGLIGQLLYLEARAAGLGATGLGCFFDDELHRALGLAGRAFQAVYHFALGGTIADARLRPELAYHHLASRRLICLPDEDNR